MGPTEVINGLDGSKLQIHWMMWCPEVIRALRVLNRRNVCSLDPTFNLILDTKTSSYEDSVNKFY